MEDIADDPNTYEAPRPEAPPDITPYLERLLGWGPAHWATVERAAVAVELARQRLSHLALIGPGDLVPLAHQIHRKTMGAARFVVVDPRRREDPCTQRLPTRSLPTLAQAMDVAAGGTVCIRAIRRPPDWVQTSERLTTEDVRLTVCYPVSHIGDLELSRPSAVVVPPIAGRDVQRMIDEYQADALAGLADRLAEYDAALAANKPKRHWDERVSRSRAIRLTSEQRKWITASCHDHHALDLAVHRFLALSWCRGVTAAAILLGMAPVSLSRWMRRRQLTVGMVIGGDPLPGGAPPSEQSAY